MHSLHFRKQILLIGSERLIEYESRVNPLIDKCAQIMGCCCYDRNLLGAKLRTNLLVSHKVVAVGDEYYPYNFYYIPPEELLGPDVEKATFNHYLANLKDRKRLDSALEEKRLQLMQQNTELQVQIAQNMQTVHAKELAELASAQKSAFVAAMSHEIRML